MRICNCSMFCCTLLYVHSSIAIILMGQRARLAIDRSICILTRPVVITGFNRSLLVDWWSIGRLKKMVDVKIPSISYAILLDSINRLKIYSV